MPSNFMSFMQCSNKVKFLYRTHDLAGDAATTDEVVDFFFKEFSSCESILWVNSVSPLQSIQDIKNCGQKLNEQGVDSVMAINTLYQHCCTANKPINFDPNKHFEKTQDLEPIKRYIYSCMGWKRETYVEHRKKGFKGLFPGHMVHVEASALAGMLIKYEEDFILCSKIEEAMNMVKTTEKDFLKNKYIQNENLSKIISIN